MESITAFKEFEISSDYHSLKGGASDTESTTRCMKDSGGSTDCQEIYQTDDCDGNILETIETWSPYPCF